MVQQGALPVIFQLSFAAKAFSLSSKVKNKFCLLRQLCSTLVTYLEPDILECEIKWALGNITMNKANGGDGIPDEQFQILKDDNVKVLYSICQKIWKIQQWLQDWKKLVFISISKKSGAKECSNYCTIGLISHANEVTLKIL